jgi:Fe2+ or Zn2+ uptake regulation protein
MRKHIPGIGQSTVYRHLDQLARQGLVQILNTDNGPARYDARYGMHAHFHCNSCETVTDVFPPHLDIAWPGQIDSLTLIAHGICKNCQQKPETQGK